MAARTSPQARRILLLSVSAGAGHMRAAEALRAVASEHPDGITATHLDVMGYVPRAFSAVYKDFYVGLVNRHPSIWRYLYDTTNEARPDALMQRTRRLVERLNTRALRKAISAESPDAIICTHFLPAELLAREIAKGEVACPVWVQVTDFDLHRMWVIPRMRGYFAANTEVAFRMRAHGLPPQGIHVTGIPVMPAFARKLDRRECAAELGLDPGRTTILLMGGGEGLGGLAAVAERLLAIEGDFQLVALAGRNAAALAHLQALAPRHPGRLVARGFTDEVERLMSCADFAITKPGGLTTSECLAVGLPMIVNAPIPGQEERNADVLLQEGVAVKALDATTLEYRVRELLLHPERLAAMRSRALAIGRPHAARAVLDVVLSAIPARVTAGP
jgi:processive 1,2-diacylglycerol beta-glucosyltransferase